MDKKEGLMQIVSAEILKDIVRETPDNEACAKSRAAADVAMEQVILEESYMVNLAAKSIADYEKRTVKKFKFAEYTELVDK
jgi:hypothetical protein